MPTMTRPSASDLKQLDQAVTNAAVAALKAALTSARAHYAGTELGDSINHLAECRLSLSASGGKVFVEVFAPFEGAEDMRCIFALTAVEQVLQ